MPFGKLTLDPRQRAAVEDTEGPVVILACPGAGKSACIAARVARLLELGVDQESILCLTFTNKAAEEMRGRIEDYSNANIENMWIGTFHSTCAKLLRSYGPDPDFRIYDEAEARGVLREILKHSLGPGAIKLSEIAQQISCMKRGACDIYDWYQDLSSRRGVSYATQLQQVYDAYDLELRENNALDFDDLILHILHIFRDEPNVQRAASSAFQYICVDEYQDTSQVEAEVVKALSSCHRNLCVVGDRNQSIYRWRGSRHYLITDFHKTYPGAKAHILGTNYRSGRELVAASQNLIRHSKDGVIYHSRAARNEAGNILFREFKDDTEEAEFIIHEVRQLVSAGLEYSDIAILYRIHAASNTVIETIRYHLLPVTIIKEDTPDLGITPDGISNLKDETDGIRLMTIHQSKGMQFRAVFLIGLEEKVLPHSKSLHDPESLEEERRLCYVAMTRAIDRLYLSSCKTRRLYGKKVPLSESRFVGEIVESIIPSQAASIRA